MKRHWLIEVPDLDNKQLYIAINDDAGTPEQQIGDVLVHEYNFCGLVIIKERSSINKVNKKIIVGF